MTVFDAQLICEVLKVAISYLMHQSRYFLIQISICVF